MLILSVCLCGVPEKKNTLKFVSRYWMLQIGLNALFQSIENLYNTLPDTESVFVLELPGIGKIESYFSFERGPRIRSFSALSIVIMSKGPLLIDQHNLLH